MDAETILAELKRAGYDIARTACELKVTTAEVQEVMGQTDDGGPAHLRQHLVATKRSDEAWSPKDMLSIRLARREYNAGMIEISQMSRDGWTRMYAIPRREPCAPRDYFSAEML